MLVSVHAFIWEQVDVAIYETHSGGEYDATNIFQKPLATGIATIGMDHIAQLGPTIENIAWHKSGIFKSQVPAFSTVQEPAASAVLERRATEKGTTLEFVNLNLALPTDVRTLGSEVQRINASLALALTNSFLTQKAPRDTNALSAEDIRRGLDQFFWPGRFHQINDGKQQWFLDGAHNELSVGIAAQWFAEAIVETQRYLILELEYLAIG